MHSISRLFIAVAGLVLAVSSAACGGSGAGATPTSPAAAQPTPTFSVGETREAPAPIENLQVNINESNPPGYFLHVLSGLPNGCITFAGYEVSQGPTDSFSITVLNNEPVDRNIACDLRYGTVGHDISLGTLQAGKT
ncbi:MAG: hypothetical protein FJ319_06575 [SAR202 cluster bacterium]|nr:hypothetical protein [SAR202 cluster bacterium]